MEISSNLILFHTIFIFKMIINWLKIIYFLLIKLIIFYDGHKEYVQNIWKEINVSKWKSTQNKNEGIQKVKEKWMKCEYSRTKNLILVEKISYIINIKYNMKYIYIIYI